MSKEKKPSEPEVSLAQIEQDAYGAIPPPNLGLFAHYSALPAAEGAGLITTIDMSGPRAVVMLQNILAGGGESLWDQPPERIIHVVNATAHFATATDDETGEVRSGPMITLSGPDGNFHTMSQYAFRALQLIAILRGAPPWHPPIAVQAVRLRSRNKRDYQSVLLVE